MKAPFKFCARTRVGFSDTDAQGIVYYGRYLPYFDLARVEYHRKLGLLGMEIGEPGVEFVMRACTIEYHAPAVFDDELEVFIRVARIGRTSATYEFAAYRVRDDAAHGHGDADARARRPRPAQGVRDPAGLPRHDPRVRGR